jgi:uncharacterized protein YjbI with pentapeptide repeats
MEREGTESMEAQGRDVQGTDVQGRDVQGRDVQGTDVQGTDVQGTDIQGTDIENQGLDAAQDQADGTRGVRDDDWGLTPGDQLRALPAEAESRGTRFVSAQAMQARLFSVYDAAAAAEEALALVQQQLTLTLDRQYYEADEIEEMADELDALLLFHTEVDEGVATDS